MSTIEEIERLERELSAAEDEYLGSIEPCGNTNCSFYDKDSTGNCTWTRKLEGCRDYEAQS